MSEDHVSFVGGARIGSRNASIPFAKLSISRKGLGLACMGQDYFFGRQRIGVLARQRGLLSTGLRIPHTVPAYPDFIVFWVAVFRPRSRFELLKAKLEEFGYEVNPCDR
jgi:hypothetical protein